MGTARSMFPAEKFVYFHNQLPHGCLSMYIHTNQLLCRQNNLSEQDKPRSQKCGLPAFGSKSECLYYSILIMPCAQNYKTVIAGTLHFNLTVSSEK